MTDLIIYGKSTCPHTNKARDAYKDAKFIDVIMDPSKMDEMLKFSGGQRRVPVIVDGESVTIGYNGGS